MTERITLQAGDYINLSDIPNEQVFNLVKQCFINAGFDDRSGEFARYSDPDRSFWGALLLTPRLSHCYSFIDGMECKRQLSLSDVFNSVNGRFNWYGLNYIHILQDDYSISPFELLEDHRSVVLSTIKRISEAPEAIISPKVSQWWDYDKGCAVGFPKKGEVVLCDGKQYEVIRSTVNNTNDKVVLLCLCVNQPNTKSDVFWMNITDIKPLDYKTSKQVTLDKALDLAAQNMSFEMFVERLYDNGMLKGGE